MAIFVNTNVSSLHGQRYLNNVNNSLNTTYQRLSSGLRINSAKDDAAGLQIADRLTTQINGLNQGNRNASDGIALMQTMEGGMDEISGMLQRIRTLAVQSSNGTITSDDRAALQKEVSALSQEINRISEQTTYGGKKILAGYDGQAETDTIFSSGVDAAQIGAAVTDSKAGTGNFTLQVGANSGDTISLTVNSFMMSSLIAATGKYIQAGAGDNGTADNELGMPGAIGGANGQEEATGAGFKVIDTKATDAAGQAVMTRRFEFDVSSQSQASLAITAVDAILNVVDGQRADLGAAQNRLESSIRNQSNVSTNSSDARSRIRDTDFAEESAALSQQNIIQQAATSMLMQANMRPQLGLSLLG